MNSQLSKLAIPQRFPLSAQAASFLREAIRKGTWTKYLPGERPLCERLQVSRPTVRTALRILEREGVLAIRHGHRNEILHSRPAAPPTRQRVIGLVAGAATTHMHRSSLQGISEMRDHLTAGGFTVEVLLCQAGSTEAQLRRVSDFVRDIHASCCVLWSVGQGIQQWFASRSFPALVLGSCHTAVKLPSLEVDYRSVCRHAAGVLLGKGHRHIAFVVPNSGLAGDLASECGFLEGVEEARGSETAHARIVRHDGTARHLSTRLDALLGASDPPTALLVAKPLHVFAVALHLLQRGFAVPRDISLLARDHDHFFEFGQPPVSHYRFSDTVYSRRLPRLTLKLIDQGSLPLEPHLVVPEFSAGGTVGRPPASRPTNS